MKIAVIGTGYWGSKIVTTLESMSHDVRQFDINDSTDSITPGTSDGVIIATPASSHKDILKKILRKNIPCLVEKPVFVSMAEYYELEPYIKNNKIMGGHILLYNPYYEKYKDLVLSKTILHMEHRRLNWGRMQKDISPIWHLAPHDVAILDDLFNDLPSYVNCKGYYITKNEQPDYVTCDLEYKDVTVHLQLGWYYHEKIRTVSCNTISGSVIWDDEFKYVKFINQYIENNKQMNDDTKDIVFYDPCKSPLNYELDSFIDYIKNDKVPKSSYEHIKRVTYIVECMEKSLIEKKEICISKTF